MKQSQISNETEQEKKSEKKNSRPVPPTSWTTCLENSEMGDDVASSSSKKPLLQGIAIKPERASEKDVKDKKSV